MRLCRRTRGAKRRKPSETATCHAHAPSTHRDASVSHLCPGHKGMSSNRPTHPTAVALPLTHTVIVACIYIFIFKHLNIQCQTRKVDAAATPPTTRRVFSKGKGAYGGCLTWKVTPSVALKAHPCTAPTAARQVYAHARVLASYPPPPRSP